ncbi:death domain-containing protein CRADD [Dunckerocampus dactyliophorus]|uniref:death domain-containing protein CRADD n=1 Tax=Dunckerocampus dactyliophorus TaxID=161453 RepID=UPI002405C1D7|nr:death domain-containing protein CRADD [Dunckerocampus dactyliophorus]
MDVIHKDLLRNHRLVLCEELLVSDTILPFLYQEAILTGAQVEEIQSQSTDRKRSLKLLDILPNRGPRAFHCFLQALDFEFSWLRDRLLQDLRARTETGAWCTSHGETSPPSGHEDAWRLPRPLGEKVPSDRELSRLASRLGGEWEAVLMDLGFSATALFRCRADHALSCHDAALAALLQWRRSEGKRATLSRLEQSLQVTGVHPSVLKDVLL